LGVGINITSETTADGDSPIVINHVRHLPYIDDVQAREQISGSHYKSDVVDNLF
jgi:hypothetical protein